MISLEQIEEKLTSAMRQRDSVALDAWRGLKTRIHNEQIAKQGELTQDDLTAAVRSEIKKRREAAESFLAGNRPEAAAKETAEAALFEQLLPPQVTEEQITQAVDELLAGKNFSVKDFGLVMGQLKTKFGSSADGGTLAKVVKMKLK